MRRGDMESNFVAVFQKCPVLDSEGGCGESPYHAPISPNIELQRNRIGVVRGAFERRKHLIGEPADGSSVRCNINIFESAASLPLLRFDRMVATI